MIRIEFTHCYGQLPDPDGVSTKAAIDAIAKAGIAPDDSLKHFVPPVHRFEKVKRKDEHTLIEIWEEGIEDQIVKAFHLPVVLPTWNRVLNSKHMQRKAMRDLIHAMVSLGMLGHFGEVGDGRIIIPSGFDWPGDDCPWADNRREWNHFIARYYKVVLNRKSVPESKLFKG